jgi:hypothetical protein
MAHYAWDGSVGFVKNPMLTIDAKGQIVDFGVVDPSVEKAGVEFFSGLLLPCFLDDLSAVELSTVHEVIGAINHCSRNGASCVLVSDEQIQLLAGKRVMKPIVLKADKVSSHRTTMNSWKSSWELLKEASLLRKEPSLHDLLIKHLLTPWDMHELVHLGGAFFPGLKPGVSLIQHVNWHNMSLISESQIKIIAYPEF